MGRIRVGALVGGALVVVAGCTSTEPGTPGAAPGAGPATAVSTPAPTGQRTTAARGTTAPPATGQPTSGRATSTRPKSIDLSGTDGCRILAGIPGAEFGLDEGEPLRKRSFNFADAQDCSRRGFDSGAYLSITTVTTQGAESFARTAQGELTRTEVNGFPAFTLANPRTPDDCFGGVDVADGQMLYLQAGYTRPEGKPGAAKLCETVRKAQAAALKVLGG